ncbi:hypothetical protein JCM17092_23260 [Haloplanus litoreus]
MIYSRDGVFVSSDPPAYRPGASRSGSGPPRIVTGRLLALFEMLGQELNPLPTEWTLASHASFDLTDGRT